MGWRPAYHCNAVVDVPCPTKNPRRLALQVSIVGDSLFREGCDAGVHRLMQRVEVRVMRPMIAICFLTRFRRERLLGRNLITVFPTVNNLSQKSFVPPRRSARSHPAVAHHAAFPTHARDDRRNIGVAKNIGKSNVFSTCTRAITCAACIDRDASMRPECKGKRITTGCNGSSSTPRVARRTSRFARKVRELFVAAIRGSNPFGANAARCQKTLQAFSPSFRARQKQRTRGVGHGFG